MQEHRDYFRGTRHRRRNAWPSDINVSSGDAGLLSFSANGEIGFHKDPAFYKYGYILVVRPAGYNVTGLKDWRGLDPQQAAGDLICFHQQRRLHALVQQGTPRSRSDHLHHPEATVWSDHPGRLWCALTLELKEFLTPEEAIAVYDRRLKSLAVNKFR